jgi:two-component system sensor histidine kinase BaeS
VVVPEQPIIGDWDADRVAQILSNLLDNAGKHAPGADVIVEVAVVGDEARVTVRDHGPGIAAVHLPRLFDRFFQVETGSAVTGGAGLGLYISRALAEAHGGRLWVESTPGAGSVFTLALPLAPVTVKADTNGHVQVGRPPLPIAARR